jgi:hypothetical protein
MFDRIAPRVAIRLHLNNTGNGIKEQRFDQSGILAKQKAVCH